VGEAIVAVKFEVVAFPGWCFRAWKLRSDGRRRRSP